MIISIEGTDRIANVAVRKLRVCKKDMVVLTTHTKEVNEYPAWIKQIKSYYHESFVDDYLVFPQFACLFQHLKQEKKESLIINQGVMTLACSGVEEYNLLSDIPYEQYKVRLKNFFREVIKQYQRYMSDTLFVMLHTKGMTRQYKDVEQELMVLLRKQKITIIECWVTSEKDVEKVVKMVTSLIA